MSEGVYIEKNRFRAMEWDGNLHEYVEREWNNSFHHLRTVCHVEPDVTLKDIINLVYHDKILKPLVEEYSWCDIDAFYKEVNTPTDKEAGIKFIELSRCIEFDDYGKHGGNVSDHIDVHGCGPHEPDQYDDRTYVDNWAIELTPTNELANAKIRLNPKVTFCDNRTKEYKHEEVDGACFSFLEVIAEIFYEISFCGSPIDREDRNQSLLEAVKEIKEGTAKTVPFEFKDDDKEKVN